MIAASYARYSSEGQREASVEDQARNCTEYAKRQGWTIGERYADKAISGSVTGRPQYQQMLRDAEAKKFDVLLVDDLSRLSRDQIETEQVRRRFIFWGVRLIGVSDGIDTAAKGNKVVSGMKGIMNDIFLDDLADKTHRGLVGQALKGNNCGGRTYGYRHVPREHPTDKDAYGRPLIVAVRREKDPEQAKWVERIFTWYADGRSPKWIANELNRLGVPGPAANWKRARGTWAVSAIKGDPKKSTGLLNNPLYRGALIWNRRQWVRNPDSKKKVPRLRPEAEWIIVKRPELAIVSPELWDRVQARQRTRQQVHVRSGRGPKYLLSGLLKCGDCGSNFIVQTYYSYGCAGRANRGAATCANRLRVSRALLEEKVLAGLKADLFTPDAFILFKKETTRLLMERQRQQRPDRQQAPKRLAVVEREIANLIAAIKQGILTPSTKAELERAEAERARLQERVQVTQTTEVAFLGILPQAEERYRKLVENLASLPASHVDEARRQIWELVGEIKLVPTAEGYLAAEMAGRYSGLLKLAVGAKLNNMVAGKGFEPLTFGL